MMGEGFPFDLVLLALVLGILGGVNRAKRERITQEKRIAEERRKERLKRELSDHESTVGV